MKTKIKLNNKIKVKEYLEKLFKKQNEIKDYVKEFKADVKRKKKSYQSYAKKFLKKSISAQSKNET